MTRFVDMHIYMESERANEKIYVEFSGFRNKKNIFKNNIWSSRFNLYDKWELLIDIKNRDKLIRY